MAYPLSRIGFVKAITDKARFRRHREVVAMELRMGSGRLKKDYFRASML